MPEYELHVAVRTDPHGAWRDGKAHAAFPPGVTWTPAEMTKWIDDGEEPRSLAHQWNAGRWRAAVINATIPQKVQWKANGADSTTIAPAKVGTTWSAEQMRAWVQDGVEPPDVDDIWNGEKWREAVRQARDSTPRNNRDKARWMADGVDTNWGRGELETGAVLKITGTRAEVDALFEQDENGNHTKRVPYENILAAQELAEVRTPGRMVHADRARNPVAAGTLPRAAQPRQGQPIGGLGV